MVSWNFDQAEPLAFAHVWLRRWGRTRVCNFQFLKVLAGQTDGRATVVDPQAIYHPPELSGVDVA
jgi:hypothetical protein